MSLQIRTTILEKSLSLESILSQIIAKIIRVPKVKTKTLGNQSSSLSFKTKVDLLYDLDRINLEEYNLLILFMEIRNQFVHNIESDSYIKVMEILGSSKKNKLLSVNQDVADFHNQLKKKQNTEEQQEKSLEFAFDFLFLKLREIILNQEKKIIEDFEKEKNLEIDSKMLEFYSVSFKIFQDTVEEFGEIYSNTLEKNIGSKTQFKELLNTFVHQKSIERIKEKFPDKNFN